MLDPSILKILVCCHKDSPLPSDNQGILLPIHAGAAISKVRLDMQRDDLLNGVPCPNISEKNPSYCELTAMYWAWKNILKLYPNLEYIGLCHYRRFFLEAEHPFPHDVVYKKEEEVSSYELPIKSLESLCAGKYDFIMARPECFKVSILEQFATLHNLEDLRLLTELINNRDGQTGAAIKREFTSSNKMSACNMFVMRWEDFDAYCSLLFPVLAEAERIIDISNYDNYNKRVFGFLSERLLSAWVKLRAQRLHVLPITQYVSNPDDYWMRPLLGRITHDPFTTLGYRISHCFKRLLSH